MRLAGYGKIESLKRDVLCQGINPKIILEPLNGVIEFPKKVITSPDCIFPEYRTITLTNPSNKNPISWRIDVSPLDKENVFFVMPAAGIINEKDTTTVKIQFRPSRSKKYDIRLPIFIEKQTIPYNELCLKAEGAAPCLLFETTDLILPTVPLNTFSSARLVIINDGYIKTHLAYSISRNVADVDLRVNFINGNHLNPVKNVCIVEVSFIAKNSVSFLTRIDFEDNNKKPYTVTVSGTADDFLFTNFFPGMSSSFSLKKGDRNKLEIFGLGIVNSNTFIVFLYYNI